MENDPNLWDCDLATGVGVEINTEVVYGGVDPTNFVAEIDVTVGLCQEISGFIPGEFYELSFDCSGRSSACGPDFQSINVSLDGVLSEDIFRDNTIFDLANERFCFTASSETHTLNFVSTIFPEVSCGIIIDNIEIIGHSLDLGDNITLCDGQVTTLDVSENGTNFLWQDGTTDPTYQINAPGVYGVEVISSVCVMYDEIAVEYNSYEINLGPDQTICSGDEITLDATSDSGIYLWQDGQTTPTIDIAEAGIYHVEVTSQGCTSFDEIVVAVENISVDLGNDIGLCEGQTTTLDATFPDANYLWQDGSTDPTFLITQAGTYTIEVIGENCSVTDEIIVDYENLSINLGPDIPMCEGETIILYIGVQDATILWQDNSVNQTFEVSEGGTYSVVVTSGNCTASDDIEITAHPIPDIDLGEDANICDDESVILDGTWPDATYLWQDGTINATYDITASGIYSLDVTANGCTGSDEIEITVDELDVDLGNDLSLCEGETVTLDVTSLNATYLWQDGSTSSTFEVVESGTYAVEVNSGACTISDEINISFGEMEIDLGPDVTICEGASYNIDATFPGATYLWQDGSSNPTLNVSDAGTYTVTVNANSCSATDEIIISVESLEIDLGADLFLCPGESAVIGINVPNATYLWQDNSTEDMLTVNESGTYSVLVNQGSCAASDEVIVTVGELQVDLGPDLSLCEGESQILNAYIPDATYLWQNNSTDSAYTVVGPGVYSVVVTSGSCSASGSVTIEYDSPAAVDLGDDLFVCTGDTFSLDANWTDANYLWQDGTTNSTYSGTLPGIYWVEVELEGCSMIDSINISTGLPNVELGNDTTLCPDNSLTLEVNLTDATYLWQDGSTENFFEVNVAGTYSVQVESDGCIVEETITVNYAPLPSADISGGIIHCPDELVALQVDIEGTPPFLLGFTRDGIPLPSIQTDNYFYELQTLQSGEYRVATITDAYCVAEPEGSTIITDYPPLAVEITYIDEICEGENVTFNANISGGNGSDYQVDWSDQINNTYSQNPLTLIPMEDVNLTFSVNDGCVVPYAEEVNVTVNHMPNPMIVTNSDSICALSEMTFESNNTELGSNCIWTFDNNTSIQDCGTITQSFSQPGFHTVTLEIETSAGCYQSVTSDSSIYVIPNPDAAYIFTVDEGTTSSPGIQFQNLSFEASSYLWEFGDGISSALESPFHNYPMDNPEEYIACLTATNDLGCSNIQCDMVEIKPELLIYIPNSFTPNEDGVNDLFKPSTNSVILPEYQLYIYDRGGSLVFQSYDQNEFWNGSNKKHVNYYVPDGVYVYHLFYREKDSSETVEISGNITLIR